MPEKAFSVCIKDSVFIDPAVGTGTFLRQTILQIYDNFKSARKGLSENQIQAEWNNYVPEHLLPRLNGFEIMMAPYAVSHLKLAMVLKDTGYDFHSDKRLQVYLTNTLEEPGNTEDQFSLFEDDPLAMESIEANKVKSNTGINIIIGNPPYSGESSNKGSWIMNLMEDYKKEPGGVIKLQERNPKWINDDYVKFLRYAQFIEEKEESGIIAFICPHGFVDNPTFRGMRWQILQEFNSIYIINLHGNSNRKEKCPDGSKDENVFDIQQGVCIAIFVKRDNSSKNVNNVLYTDVWGTRESKYSFLNDSSFISTTFQIAPTINPDYNFTPTNVDLMQKYNNGFSIDELFLNYSVGIVTAKDKVLIASTKEKLIEQVTSYYGFPADSSKIHSIYYRPLDKQYIYYDTSLLERSRETIMRSFFYENIGLITARSNKGEDCSQFLISDVMSEAKCGERTTQSALFPLYIYNDRLNGTDKYLNLNIDILKKIDFSLGSNFSSLSHSYIKNTYEDILAYIYGVLYLEDYRTKYKSFINSAFPRIPYPQDVKVFNKIVFYGRRLIDLHLMNNWHVELNNRDYSLIGKTIEKITYKNKIIYIGKEIPFYEVEENVWSFTMCGYQPLQKWLKDRRGLVLEEHDLIRFKEIQSCILQTIQIMHVLNSDEQVQLIIP